MRAISVKLYEFGPVVQVKMVKETEGNYLGLVLLDVFHRRGPTFSLCISLHFP